MSHFRILRVDHYDPVIVGKRNRRLYTVYGIIPGLILVAFNLSSIGSMSYGLKYLISVPLIIVGAVLIMIKVRKNNENLKPIGEVEITQSCLKKRIGDSLTEIDFQNVKELTLTKHMPSTRLAESKGQYYSYILKIESIDGEEDTFVVTDRSIDQNHKLSVLDTIKTLKKIVHFSVVINV
ncbi:MAG: hypothetical protein NTW82_02565 [Bacteroidia bacterium]|nr:hypothetical protein [Bacteroidia bacterium]